MLRLKLRRTLLSWLLLSATFGLCAGQFAGAAPLVSSGACPALFVGGAPPRIVRPTLARDTTMLCFTDYAVLDSALTRTPLWSAEHLTRASVQAARGERRIGHFHAERRLPYGARSELSDYRRSGFDRGHMTPSGDMPNDASQNETFSLANIVPQNHVNNTRLWAGIESAVRTLARREGELYVITGPIFEGATLATVGRVAVPTSLFKAVYDPKRGLGAAYLVTNTATDHYDTVSLATLGNRIGIDLFPALSGRATHELLPLPPPQSRSYSRRNGRRGGYGYR